ncbi:MAG: hypothetical protein ACJ8C4_00520 [Gemmataceae bacterium]
MIQWRKPKRDRGIAGEHLRITSVDGLYTVARSHIPYGARNSYPDRWYAILNLPRRQQILSTHRSREAAIQACEDHEKVFA